MSTSKAINGLKKHIMLFVNIFARIWTYSKCYLPNLFEQTISYINISQKKWYYVGINESHVQELWKGI